MRTKRMAKGASALVVDEPEGRRRRSDAARTENEARLHGSRERRPGTFRRTVVALPAAPARRPQSTCWRSCSRAHYGDRVLASPANENNEIGVSKVLLAVQPKHEPRRRNGRAPRRRHRRRSAASRVRTSASSPISAKRTWKFSVPASGWHKPSGRLFSLGAHAVLNASDSDPRCARAACRSRRIWYGAGCAATPGVWIADHRTLLLTYGADRQAHEFDIRVPGMHNRANLAAAIGGCARARGAARSTRSAVPALTLPPDRYERNTVPGGIQTDLRCVQCERERHVGGARRVCRRGRPPHRRAGKHGRTRR